MTEKKDAERQIPARIQRVVNPGPKISLVMIVKNEETVLRRCVESVKQIIDEFIIVDTGSTDSTHEIIQSYGKLYEMPYTFEVETRQKALALATGDYILMMDADEWIPRNVMKLRQYASFGVNCVAPVIHDVTGDPLIVTNMYYRNRIFKNNGQWYYTGPKTHGYITGPLPALHDKNVVVYHCHDHKKNSPDASIAKKDRTLGPLEQAIKDNPSDTRAHFYLGRTYMSNTVNRLADAIKTFEHYLAMPNSTFAEERWWAAYDIARCKCWLEDDDGCIAACDRAMEMNKNRAEAYVLKGYIYYKRGQWETAATYFTQAMQCPVPDSTLFVDPRQYWEIPAQYLAICYYHLGDIRKARDLSKELIARMPTVSQTLVNNIKKYETLLNTQASGARV